jgi:hypothetical protein
MDHEPWCQQKAFGHSDAAKRIADTYSLHLIGMGDGAIRKWFAAALIDGRSDDTLYDSKSDCIHHQHNNEQYYTYIRIGPRSMRVCEAEVMLKTARTLYDNGMRMVDPDSHTGGPDAIKRLTAEDQMQQSVGNNTNLIMPWEA